MLIGLLSLFSVGLVAMSMGGDDDADTGAGVDQGTSPDTPLQDTTDADDTASESASLPNELVTISAPDGSVLPDAPSISEGPDEGADADRDFLVTGPEGAPSIEVGYDAETAFGVQPGPATTTVVAGLNSNVEGMPPVYQSATTQEVDEDGTNFTQTLLTAIFNGGADIELQVDQDQIGTHVSQINLSNPNASLHFNFGDDVTGNLHLITNQVELTGNGDSSSETTMYVIETDANTPELQAADIEASLSDDGESTGTTRLIAEIYLGADALEISGSGVVGEDYATILSNFVNEVPDITANISWASIGEHDGGTTEDAPDALLDGSETGVLTPITVTPVLDGTPQEEPEEDTSGQGGAQEGGQDDDIINLFNDDQNDLPVNLPIDFTQEELEALAEANNVDTPEELLELLGINSDIIELNDLGGFDLPDLNNLPDFGGFKVGASAA